MTPGTYNPTLVAATILIAIVAGYTTLDLANRVTVARGRVRRAWLAGGSLATGIGLWSMHFVGILALRLPGDPIAFDLSRLLLSVLVAIAASAVLLWTAGRAVRARGLLVPAGLVLAGGLGGVHYLAVWSMRPAAAVEWRSVLVLASIGLAVVAAYLALSLAIRYREETTRRGQWRRAAGGVVVGLAVSAMHYTAMLAMSFAPVAVRLPVREEDLLGSEGLAVAIAGAALFLLGIALAGSAMARALTRRTEAAEEAERRAHEEVVLREVAHKLTAAFEVEDVIRWITYGALQAARADGAYVERIYDRKDVVIVAVAGWGHPPLRLRMPFPGSLAERAVATGKPELVEDLTEEERPIARYLRASCGRCAGLVVPLLAVGEPLGALVLLRRPEQPPFVPEEVTRVRILADLALLAFRRVRLLEREREARAEAERKAREEVALRRAAQVLGAAFGIDKAIHEIARSALDACDADGSLVTRIDIERDEIEVVATAGERVPPPGARLPYPGSFTQEVVERGKPVFIPSLAEAAAAGRRIPPEVLAVYGAYSAVVVPLRDAGEAIGALTLVRSPGRESFRGDEVSRAGTFGDLAGLAFARVHLLEETERRRVDLEQVMESRARLTRGFSHDVKNPLAAADGHAQLLLEEIAGALNEKQKESVERIRRSIHAALGLIDDLVELALAEAGRITVEREPVDLRELAVEMMEEYRAQAEAKGLRLECVIPDQLPVIESDATRIRQILGNLVSNAVKYTEVGGVTLRIAVRSGPGAPGAGDWVSVEVNDTGPGVPEEKRHLLFREFTRLEPGTERGAGLGLAISRRVAHALGGEITVESEVGRGTTFTLWLPYE